VGAGLAVGGVIGNGIDQRRHQATVDFLALRNGMVINLADIAIAVGTVLMIAAFLQS
jgi:lipoprotein signal peptidase